MQKQLRKLREFPTTQFAYDYKQTKFAQLAWRKFAQKRVQKSFVMKSCPDNFKSLLRT